MLLQMPAQAVRLIFFAMFKIQRVIERTYGTQSYGVDLFCRYTVPNGTVPFGALNCPACRETIEDCAPPFTGDGLGPLLFMVFG